MADANAVNMDADEADALLKFQQSFLLLQKGVLVGLIACICVCIHIYVKMS
jgi:hypothetical protein